MTVAPGDTLPAATLLEITEGGPTEVSLLDFTRGRKVVIFGLPGAYTGTCTRAHVPSFIRTAGALAEKGVAAIACVAVNDPFVMKAWGESTGATAAGIRMLADPGSDLTKALGLDFSNPKVGFFSRSRRFSMLVANGVVQVLNVEESPGQCEISAGETLLRQIESAEA